MHAVSTCLRTCDLQRFAYLSIHFFKRAHPEELYEVTYWNVVARKNVFLKEKVGEAKFEGKKAGKAGRGDQSVIGRDKHTVNNNNNNNNKPTTPNEQWLLTPEHSLAEFISQDSVAFNLTNLVLIRH